MDWIAATLELLGSYILGEKIAYGFIVNVLALACWALVAVRKKLYGLLALTVIGAIVNLINYIKWCL